jgi:amino-acid N-acetyltransferase
VCFGQTGAVSDIVEVPETERAFYVAEFAGGTIVVSLPHRHWLTPEVVEAVAGSLDEGGARLVLVEGVDDLEPRPSTTESIPGSIPESIVGSAEVWLPSEELDPAGLASLWLAVADSAVVTVRTRRARCPLVAAHVAASLRALKLVITDPAGGWGRPPRSFADVSTHRDAYRAQLGERQDGMVVEALEVALSGGVSSVNLCRAADLERELFTFDGTGTLFTSGGYVAVAPLRIDDLAAVEDLVAQGTADGLLRPRTRLEVARLAATGIGAKVVGSGHLAGVVGLETDAYREDNVGEVAGLYTVSRFSGSGAGGALIDELLARAGGLGLSAVFAVTVAEPAAALFERKGFVEVDQAVLPTSKWADYDDARRSRARAFWIDIEAGRF